MATVISKEEDDETLRTWNSLATMYRERFMDMTLYNHTYDAFLDQLKQQRVDVLDVLDVGCGPGVVGKYLLDKVNSNSGSSGNEGEGGVQSKQTMRLTGIDAASNMIELAQQYIPEATWLELDSRSLAVELPLLDDKAGYHGIVVGFCIPYLSAEDVQKLLKDCHTLLFANGVLYLSFVPGLQESSEFKTNKSGQRVYFRYYEEETIQNWLEVSDYGIMSSFHVSFPRPNNESEVHTVFIATKR